MDAGEFCLLVESDGNGSEERLVGFEARLVMTRNDNSVWCVWILIVQIEFNWPSESFLQVLQISFPFFSFGAAEAGAGRRRLLFIS